MSIVRPLAPEDAVQLAGLIDEYMEETYRRRWQGTVASINRDLFGAEAHALVAVDDAELVGFALWRRAYDAHHVMRGGALIDLYVQRPYRGGSLAPELLLATMAAVSADGGHYLEGQGVSASSERLYERLAVNSTVSHFIVSGRAFRELAGLRGKPLREALRLAPPKSANFEP